MARNTSITLGDHFGSFVDERVAAGRYGSASEVVRAGLRILEAEEQKLEALRAALIEGEASGRSSRRVKDIVNEAKAELNAQ
jgi:antitoxin ParD1/3/4